MFYYKSLKNLIMKKLLVFSMLLVSFVSYGQFKNLFKTSPKIIDTTQDKVDDIQKFEDLNSSLFQTKIIEIPNKNQKELLNIYKNWVGTTYRSSKEVVNSESENQIILDYVTKDMTGYFKTLGMKTPMTYSWYVRLVAQFKDGKIRLMIYDDGNTYKAPIDYRYGSPTPSHSIYVKNAELIEKPKTINDLYISRNGDVEEGIKSKQGWIYDIRLQWEKEINNTLLSIETYMKNNNALVKTDNW